MNSRVTDQNSMFLVIVYEDLVKIEGILKKEGYEKILTNNTGLRRKICQKTE